jgi:L-serine dehydratase
VSSSEWTGDSPVGVSELFKIGIGPSSSHTMGPMTAAATFAHGLGAREPRVAAVRATVFGSLAWTGRGHATDKAVMLGLTGERPDGIDPARIDGTVAVIRSARRLRLPGGTEVPFDPDRDIVFDRDRVFDRHSNAMLFETWDAAGQVIAREVWFSIGGGFVIRDGAEAAAAQPAAPVPFPFANAVELMRVAQAAGLTFAQLVFANEAARARPEVIDANLDRIADAMNGCIDRGLAIDGELPGGLKVRRRAKAIHQRLAMEAQRNTNAPHLAMDYVSVFAIAVNEENAAGGRVVTAPTNGAAGVVPAVLRYYRDFCSDATREGMRNFLLAATAVGAIIKRNASISGAEVGCQGEVGSAAAMAAAGLAAALGGSNAQIENAAEIALEHHLGMTCDPIGGLVQIPCIERNAFGAIKAINAASLALHGDGTHVVSLDQVIETMRQTGADMQAKYKETSRGGLAVNVPEC